MKYRIGIFLAVILAIAFFARALPLDYSYFPEPDSFFHARSVELIISGQKIPGIDPISQQGRPYMNSPLFHAYFASFELLSGIGTVLIVKLLSIVFALATVLLTFLISKRMFGNRIALFSAFALAIMTIYVLRTSAFARPDAFALMILGAGILFFLMREDLLAAIASVGIALSNPIATGIAFVAALLFFWALALVKKADARTKSVFAISLVFFLVYALWLLHFQMPWTSFYSGMAFESAEMQQTTVVWYLLSFSFAWIFALFAFVKMKGNYFLKTWAVSAAFLSIWALRFALFLTIPMAILAGFGICALEKKTRRQWIAFYALVILLVSVTAVPLLFESGPYVPEPQEKAMKWISVYTPQSASLASDWDFGDPLGYLAKRKVVVDGHFEFNPSVQARNDSIKIIASSSDCKKIFAEVKKWGIDYYFLNQRDFDSLTYKNGLLEANCGFISKEYANDESAVLKFGAR